MKLLIIGCGSVGQRHARNAKSLGAELLLSDLDLASMHKLSDELGKARCYPHFLKATEHEDIDAAVVATPTSLHVEMATQLAERGVHLLVEKPLSNSLDGTDKLLRVVEQNRVTAMMGHSYRFHEGLLTLERLLNEQAIGKVYHVWSYSGWYLPDWHVHEDYRRGYAARTSLGGGAALTSLSHSFDTIGWLFGEIEEIVGWKTKLSSLAIDVDDSAFCQLRTRRGVVITCVVDFLSRLPRNHLLLTGSEGHIEADFTNHLIEVWRAKDKRFPPSVPEVAEVPGRIKILKNGVQYDSEPERIRYDFEENRRYVAEMAHFLERIKTQAVEFDLDLRSGLRVLKLISQTHFQSVSGEGSASQ